MSLHDPVSDLLTRLRNGSKARLPEVSVPHSDLKEGVVAILQREGYVRSFAVVGEKLKTINVSLKYKGKTPALTGLRQISKPGLRVYVGVNELPKVLNGLGVAIVSTSKGLLTDKQARADNFGGEVIAYVW